MLKIRTAKDERHETFDKRTIIFSGIPTHAREQDLATAFHKFGAITSIEVPSVDHVVNAQLEAKGITRDKF